MERQRAELGGELRRRFRRDCSASFISSQCWPRDSTSASENGTGAGTAIEASGCGAAANGAAGAPAGLNSGVPLACFESGKRGRRASEAGAGDAGLGGVKVLSGLDTTM